MPTYRDALGNQWRIELDGFLMRRLKHEHSFNICDVTGVGPESLSSLLQDIERLVDVLWTCCEEQAITKKLTEIDFAKGLRGDALEEATTALMRAITDFFPSQQQRDLNRAIIEKATEAGKKLLEMATAGIEEINVDSLATSATDTFSSSEESLESIRSD